MIIMKNDLYTFHVLYFYIFCKYVFWFYEFLTYIFDNPWDALQSPLPYSKDVEYLLTGR